jgi:hypothetical protein
VVLLVDIGVVVGGQQRSVSTPKMPGLRRGEFQGGSQVLFLRERRFLPREVQGVWEVFR